MRAAGMLPQCYWCKQQSEQCEELYLQLAIKGHEHKIPRQPPSRLAEAESKLPASTLMVERARLAHASLPSNPSTTTLWREAQRAQGPAQGPAQAAQGPAQGPAVSTWQQEQQAVWQEQDPSYVTIQQQLWLTAAALGRPDPRDPGTCRHAVDSPDTPCPSCGKEMDPDPVASNSCTFEGGRLVGFYSTERVTVFSRTCTHCDHVAPFDGMGCGVVNMSNKVLFCEEVLRNYWHGFFQQKLLTMDAYFNTIQRK